MIKKQWMVGFVVICMAGVVSAQGVSMLEFGGGYLNPKDTKAGTIWGGSYGFSIDERVNISVGISYFHKNYSKTSKVADSTYASNYKTNTIQKELEYNTTLLPISANANVRIPIQPPLYWYLGGSITYQFLFNTEKNYEENVSEKRTYSGLGWMLRAGIELAIGSRSSLFVEGFYNIGKVKRNVEETVKGLPIWEEVDVSGLGCRAGLRLEFF